MKKLWVALVAYLVLALVAFATLSDTRFRLATVVILAALAVKSVVHSRRGDVEVQGERGASAGKARAKREGEAGSEANVAEP